MKTRDYILLTDRKVEVALSAIRARLLSWEQRWFPDEPTAEVACVRAEGIEVGGNILAPPGLEALCACTALTAGDCDRLMQAMLGDEPVAVNSMTPAYAAWTRSVAEEAIADLMNALCSGHEDRLESGSAKSARSLEPVAQQSNSFSQPGYGTLVCNLRIAQVDFRIYVGGQVSLGLTGKKPNSARSPTAGALVGLHRVAGQHLTKIEVATRSSEVPYEAVRELAVGDVLTLDHSISEPLEAIVDGAARAGSVFLGRMDAKRAVRVSLPK